MKCFQGMKITIASKIIAKLNANIPLITIRSTTEIG